MILAERIRAQSILDYIFIEPSVIIVDHHNKLIQTIRCNYQSNQKRDASPKDRSKLSIAIFSERDVLTVEIKFLKIVTQFIVLHIYFDY